MKVSEERLAREPLLQRLRLVLTELETGTRSGLDVVFGWNLERPYRENWFLYLRDADDFTASERTTFCGVAPIPLSANAPAEFLRRGIRLIEEDDTFIRMNIQIRADLSDGGERTGFVESKFGQDWSVTGDTVEDLNRRNLMRRVT